MSAEAAQNRSEDLICDSCGHVNPGENNFCGNCGTPIRLAAEGLAEATAEHVSEQLPSFAEIFGLESPSQRRSPEQSPISGPSFLGLDGEPTTPAPDFGYAESGSHAGRWVALFVVLGLIAVGLAEWKSIRGIVLPRVAQLKSYTEGTPPPQPQAPTPSPAATEQNPVSSTPAETATPEPARANDSSSSADAAKADVGNTATNSAASTSSPATQKTSKAQPAEEEENSAEDTQPPEESTKQQGRTAKNRRQDRIEEASPGKSRRGTGQVRRDRQIEGTKPSLAPDNSLVLAGEKYLYGRGAPRSCQQALVYFHTAAQAQNPRAMSHLGTMYATGTCVRQDRVQAYRWLSQAFAEESSNHFLERNLTMLWRDMTPAEKQVVLTRSR